MSLTFIKVQAVLDLIGDFAGCICWRSPDGSGRNAVLRFTLKANDKLERYIRIYRQDSRTGLIVYPKFDKKRKKQECPYTVLTLHKWRSISEVRCKGHSELLNIQETMDGGEFGYPRPGEYGRAIHDCSRIASKIDTLITALEEEYQRTKVLNYVIGCCDWSLNTIPPEM